MLRHPIGQASTSAHPRSHPLPYRSLCAAANLVNASTGGADAPFLQASFPGSDRRRRRRNDRVLAGAGRGKERLQGRVVDLCRLDAVGLRRRVRHREKMGRQIRHQYRGQAIQRLRRIDQSIYGGRLRRRDHHQHGCAVNSGGRRRRYHGGDRGRFLQRQRRGDPEGQGSAQGHPRPAGQPSGIFRVALSAGPGTGEHRRSRKRI